MKAILSVAVLSLLGISSMAFADTYTGVVSDTKKFHNGGEVVDLDGHYHPAFDRAPTVTYHFHWLAA